MMQPSVLVTGTSSGIGLATVARFHAAGWQVLATVRRAGDAAMLHDRFAGIEALVIDLTDSDAVARVIGDMLAARGGVDVVVNNAGASVIGAAEELALADFRAQLELNLLAAIQVTQLALPYLRARGTVEHAAPSRQDAGAFTGAMARTTAGIPASTAGAGPRIIQVSSGFGRIALPMFSAYCASKYALEGFSEALAGEVAPFGIGVSLIEPGAVATRFDDNRREGTHYRADGPYAALYRAMRARLAGSHERGASTADEVAAVIFGAATARRPALRYTVGRMGMLAALAARFAPDAARQFAIRQLTRPRR